MFPAVPQNKAMLRLCVQTEHTHTQLDRVVDALSRHLPSIEEMLGDTGDYSAGAVGHAEAAGVDHEDAVEVDGERVGV